MKRSIPIQSPPDYNSIIPPDLGGASAVPPPPASSTGIDLDNLSPEESSAIPNEGSANIKFKVHHRRSETHIHPKTGEKTERHHIRAHVTDWSPHEEEAKEPPKKKKLTASTNAQDAVMDGLPS